MAGYRWQENQREASPRQLLNFPTVFISGGFKTRPLILYSLFVILPQQPFEGIQQGLLLKRLAQESHARNGGQAP